MIRSGKVQWSQTKWLIVGVVAMAVIFSLMVIWSDLMKGGGTNAIETVLNYFSTRSPNLE